MMDTRGSWRALATCANVWVWVWVKIEQVNRRLIFLGICPVRADSGTATPVGDNVRTMVPSE